MVLKEIKENVSVNSSQEFKGQIGGFPAVFKIKNSESKFKRSRNRSDLVQEDDEITHQVQQINQIKQNYNREEASLLKANDLFKTGDQSEQSGPSDETRERFFLSGELCMVQDPTEETKSLQEILDYTRSSSFQIRSRAWGILAKIFRNFKENPQQVILKEVDKVNIGLYLRVGLDQKKGFSEVLDILSLLMNSNPDSFKLEDIAFSRSNILFNGKSEVLLKEYTNVVIGSKIKAEAHTDDSFGSIKTLLKQEPMMGLLKGNIIDRLGYLITTELHDWDFIKVLEILLSFSRYSKKSANEIVEKGLLETLIKFSRRRDARGLIFLIFYHICVSSRRNAQEFVVKNGLDVVMASISDIDLDSEIVVAWKILSVCSKYGLTRGILIDYRPMLYAKAREYFTFSNDVLQLKARVGLLKVLQDFVYLMPKGFVMGSLDDEMKPFLDILLSSFSWIIDLEKVEDGSEFLHLASISSALDFFSSYLTRLDPNVSTSNLCSQIFALIRDLYPIFRAKALELSLKGVCPVDETPPASWKLQKFPEELSKKIYDLTNQTFGMDFFSSIIDLKNVINLWIHDTIDIEADIQTIIDYIIGQPELYWTRFYAQGRVALINSYLKSCDVDLLSEKCQGRLYFYLLSAIQPGQEIIGSRTLFSLFKILKSSLLENLSHFSKEHKMAMLDIYDKSFYSDSSLKNSSANYNHDYESIVSLWMEIEENAPTLPLSRYWMYSPIDAFLNEEQNQITICSEDLIAYICIVYSIISMHKDFGSGLDIGKLMIATMKICLLSTSTDEAICLEPMIQSCIKYVLSEWDSKPVINLESIMDSEVNFYQLYSQLISNYSASSYGNELWGRLLLIPLHKMYPRDYKDLFFNSLEPKILRLITSPLLLNSRDYVITREDHKKLNIYDKLIASKCITMEKNPFLYYILTADHS